MSGFGVVKHGECILSRTPEYYVLSEIKQRCTNPNNRQFGDYGGRGIAVCERWSGELGIENFIQDMGRRPSERHSIDRIDNDGNYEPGNCRWATRQQQQRNKRNNRKITVNGVTRCMTEWAEINGIPFGTVSQRIYVRGWDDVRAVTEPATRSKPRLTLTIEGVTKTIREWSKESGVPERVIRQRSWKGVPPKEAVFTPLLQRGIRCQQAITC